MSKCIVDAGTLHKVLLALRGPREWLDETVPAELVDALCADYDAHTARMSAGEVWHYIPAVPTEAMVMAGETAVCVSRNEFEPYEGDWSPHPDALDAVAAYKAMIAVGSGDV